MGDRAAWSFSAFGARLLGGHARRVLVRLFFCLFVRRQVDNLKNVINAKIKVNDWFLNKFMQFQPRFKILKIGNGQNF